MRYYLRKNRVWAGDDENMSGLNPFMTEKGIRPLKGYECMYYLRPL